MVQTDTDDLPDLRQLQITARQHERGHQTKQDHHK